METRKTIATLLAVGMFLALVGAAQAAFVAYHDLGGTTADAPGAYVTDQGADPTQTIRLRNFTDNADTGVDFSITGANGSTDADSSANRYPDAGTDAAAIFGTAASPIVTHGGSTNEGGGTGSGSTTFTLAGLDPTQLYDVAIYGDRNLGADGVERFTLNGADAAVNSSSAYKISSTVTDMETRPNATVGHVARWSDIRPGADGTVTIDIDPEVSSPSNIAYLTALRLQETGAAPPPPPPLSAITAYHDMGGEPSPGNITTQQSLDTTHTLIDFATGADTGIDFSVAGATGIDTRTGTVTRPPNAGTPAGDLFLASGIDLDDGMVNLSAKSASSMTFTFAGLDPEWLYDVALYGDRNSPADGVERFTLIGADSAINSSSTGIIDALTTDMETRPNNTTGNVARWTDINPGADGIITIDIDPTVSSDINIAYISGVRLEGAAPERDDIIPEPATMAMLGLAFAGLGGYVKRRKRL